MKVFFVGYKEVGQLDHGQLDRDRQIMVSIDFRQNAQGIKWYYLWNRMVGEMFAVLRRKDKGAHIGIVTKRTELANLELNDQNHTPWQRVSRV